MTKPNEKLREIIKDKGFFLWEVAHEMGIHEVTFTTWLRRPLTEQKLQQVNKALASLEKQK